ncbi:hypothetical protein F5Y13DRAFT_169226 [Hypoxylon sp. FL1857]|nr:hypothetical protein F5Y13DRAFT_169226 [Hypoxylon sp. FL1857]
MSNPKPIIFKFSLDPYLRIDDEEQLAADRTIGKIDQKATIQVAWNAEEAVRLIEANPHPHAILITDGGIALPENEHLSRQVISYAQNGGTVILTLFFATRTTPKNFNSYMGQWELPWKSISYKLEECIVNDGAKGRPALIWMRGLPAYYYSKSALLLNVRHDACWYLTAKFVEYEGYDGKPYQQMRTGSEAPIAFTQVGKGFLGYTGDMINNDATDAVVLSMLGFNYQVQWCTCGNEKFA